MITAEQAMALLIESNPVPNVSMTQPGGSRPVAHLAASETRSSDMTELKTRKQPVLPARRRRLAIGAATTVLIVVIGAVIISQTGNRNPVADTHPPTTELPTPTTQASPLTPVDVATEITAAYARREYARAATYLAEGVDPAIVANPEPDPLFERFLEATGSQTVVGLCRVAAQAAEGTLVTCDHAYHNFRSDEIGRGPFGRGSYYVVTVRDAGVVDFEDRVTEEAFTDPEGFSKQMWEPFATWIDQNHPEAIEAMYDPYPTGWRITEESIPLWDRYLSEWASSMRGS